MTYTLDLLRELDEEIQTQPESLRPSTGAQKLEVLEFMKTHHPQMYAELQQIYDKNLRIVALWRLMYRDMVAFQLGEPTRNLQFVGGVPRPS